MGSQESLFPPLTPPHTSALHNVLIYVFKPSLKPLVTIIKNPYSFHSLPYVFQPKFPQFSPPFSPIENRKGSSRTNHQQEDQNTPEPTPMWGSEVTNPYMDNLRLSNMPESAVTIPSVNISEGHLAPKVIMEFNVSSSTFYPVVFPREATIFAAVCCILLVIIGTIGRSTVGLTTYYTLNQNKNFMTYGIHFFS